MPKLSAAGLFTLSTTLRQWSSVNPKPGSLPWLCRNCYSQSLQLQKQPELRCGSKSLKPSQLLLAAQKQDNARPSRSLSSFHSSAKRRNEIPPPSPTSPSRPPSTSSSSTNSQSTSSPTTSSKPSSSSLPSAEESQRSALSKRFTHLMDHVQSNIFIAGQRLNDLTGYSGIEALKRSIEEQEVRVASTREALTSARDRYATAISQRSTSQRESNELLQRKHLWTPGDLERFTALYRSDHANEVAEQAAREGLSLAEREAEEAAALLSGSILARYHEEQIWSDKIRRMSTWGTWGLMGVNVLLFVVFQIVVEPWRRRRLVKGFEEKVVQALKRDEGRGDGFGAAEAGKITVDGESIDLRPDIMTAAVGENVNTTGSKGVDVAAAENPSSETSNTNLDTSLAVTPDISIPLTASPTNDTPTSSSPATISSLLSPRSLKTLFSSNPLISSIFPPSPTTNPSRLSNEETIHVRRIDLTRQLLEAATVGAACAGILVAVVMRFVISR